MVRRLPEITTFQVLYCEIWKNRVCHSRRFFALSEGQYVYMYIYIYIFLLGNNMFLVGNDMFLSKMICFCLGNIFCGGK